MGVDIFDQCPLTWVCMTKGLVTFVIRNFKRHVQRLLMTNVKPAAADKLNRDRYLPTLLLNRFDKIAAFCAYAYCITRATLVFPVSVRGRFRCVSASTSCTLTGSRCPIRTSPSPSST